MDYRQVASGEPDSRTPSHPAHPPHPSGHRTCVDRVGPEGLGTQAVPTALHGVNRSPTKRCRRDVGTTIGGSTLACPVRAGVGNATRCAVLLSRGTRLAFHVVDNGAATQDTLAFPVLDPEPPGVGDFRIVGARVLCCLLSKDCGHSEYLRCVGSSDLVNYSRMRREAGNEPKIGLVIGGRYDRDHFSTTESLQAGTGQASIRSRIPSGIG